MTHNPFRPLCLPLFLAAGLLAGCSNQPSCGEAHPYLTNAERPPLQAPAGVTVPTPDQAYVVPEVKPGAGQAGGCIITPPDVLGPLGAPGSANQVAPTITRHRHGKVIEETPGKPAAPPGSPAPAAGTQAAPAVATQPPME